jgi:predicted nucleic acid-binding protein
VSRLVIDASVAIKWVVGEDGTEAALQLRRHALTAPDLLAAECANILWKKTRLGELSADEASLAARLLARADIDLISTRPFLETATRIAIAIDHPAYDCVYLALAEAEDLPFVTADERLLHKVRRNASEPFSARTMSLTESMTSH